MNTGAKSTPRRNGQDLPVRRRHAVVIKQVRKANVVQRIDTAGAELRHRGLGEEGRKVGWWCERGERAAGAAFIAIA